MKKVINLTLCLFLLLTSTLSAQKVHKDLQAMKSGNSTKFQASQGSTVVSELILEKVGKKTYIRPNFEGTNTTKIKVELFSKGRKVYSQSMNERGPNASLQEDIYTKELVKTSIIDITENEVWWGVLAVAYCCLELEAGSNGWSVGFDCDCLEGIFGIIIDDGSHDTQSFNNISEVKITPLNGDIERFSKINTLK